MSECLELGIMRCHESRASSFEQMVENGARQGRALLRISARTQFIKNDERAMIDLLEDPNDICNVTAECAERLLDGLLVADIGIDRVKAGKFRAALRRD